MRNDRFDGKKKFCGKITRAISHVSDPSRSKGTLGNNAEKRAEDGMSRGSGRPKRSYLGKEADNNVKLPSPSLNLSPGKRDDRDKNSR